MSVATIIGRWAADLAMAARPGVEVRWHTRTGWNLSQDEGKISVTLNSDDTTFGFMGVFFFDGSSKFFGQMHSKDFEKWAIDKYPEIFKPKVDPPRRK